MMESHRVSMVAGDRPETRSWRSGENDVTWQYTGGPLGLDTCDTRDVGIANFFVFV